MKKIKTKKILIISLMICLIISYCSSQEPTTIGRCEVTNSGKLSGEIRQNLNVPSDATWILEGLAYVRSGATLTIGAGATIIADTSTLSALVVDRGARIMSVGTAARPIVFTSCAGDGQRAPSDWGGIVIHGRANAAGPSGGSDLTRSYITEIETGMYGGSQNNDSSGTIQYTRIEFAGKETSANVEYNGLFLAGVGSGTTIDHLQVHRGSDDGIEIFGGHVNLSYIVLSNNQDDQLDVDEGWVGAAQNVVIITGDDNDHAIEFDGTASGWTDSSKGANPVFSNFTIVSTGSKSKAGIFAIRDQGAMQIYNSYIANFKGNQLIASNKTDEAVDGSLTEVFSSNLMHRLVKADDSAHTPNSLGCMGEQPRDCSGSADLNSIFPDGSANNSPNASANIGNTTPGGVMFPNSFTFTTSISQIKPSAALTGITTYADPPAAGSGQNISTPTYVGAFAPGGTDNTWADDWTSFPAD